MSKFRSHDKLNAAVAKNLRQLREASGFSQDELAARCHIHRTYIGAIERCERNITLATLSQIARGLKCRPTDLLEE